MIQCNLSRAYAKGVVIYTTLNITGLQLTITRFSLG